MLEDIFDLSRTFLKLRKSNYQRYFLRDTKLSHRFSIILGERGVGKTTMLVQYLLSVAKGNALSDKILYVQADHFLIQQYSLYAIAEQFFHYGGQVIAFDEIHKYPNWSNELKSIYDTFPTLRIFASGSSILEIHRGSHDLSRRAIVYHLYGLSLREFIELKYNLQIPHQNLSTILSDASKLSHSIVDQLEKSGLKILKVFLEYLEYGYYPYFLEIGSLDEFKLTLQQNLHTTLEADLSAIYPKLTGNSIYKIKQLLSYSAQAVPFTPQWKKIGEIIAVTDLRTLKSYFKYLQDAHLICQLQVATKKLKGVEASEKVYLANPNQLYAISFEQPEVGMLRVTFAYCMLQTRHLVQRAGKADFMIDRKIHLEIGGRNKSTAQIRDQSNGYLFLDNIEHGFKEKIPLWLLGFLY